MCREPADRIPTMPQILRDNAVRIFAEEDGVNWIEGLKRCIEEPCLVYDYTIRLVETINCDGLRLFAATDSMKIQRKGAELIVLDPDTGGRIGRIDTLGGGGVVMDSPVPPVETLDEARERLDRLAEEFDDEKIENLRNARKRVPEKFVASSPGGITMNTYNALRGREQAMYDFFERPDFVNAVLDLQAEAMIKRAEKLLKADIDVFYIGDPSSSASLISPQHFEKFCFPAYQKFCRHFKNDDILIYIHICGNSNPILEMMADTGANVVEPLDPLGGVSVADAKKRIGHKVALMGGVNTVTLSQGTPEDVTREAIQKCREGGPYGYILAAGDMVPPDTSLENLQALVDVAVKSLWR